MTDLGWNEYLMGFAEQAARKSKDSTKVGAALIGPDGRTALLPSYNGPPMGVQDTPERRERPTKYLFASHAEANLIAFAARHGIRTDGCSVFVTHMPCASCARTLIQAGIRRVIYGPGTTSMPREEFEAAAVMFREAGVEVVGPPVWSRPAGDPPFMICSTPDPVKPWYPDDNPFWRELTPGETVNADQRVYVLYGYERRDRRYTHTSISARVARWSEVVAWRPAEAMGC